MRTGLCRRTLPASQHRTPVGTHHFFGRPPRGHPPLVQPHDTIADLLRLHQVVGHKQDGRPLAAQLVDAIQALALKAQVTYGQHFVHQQHLGLYVDRHGKRQPQLHPAAVRAHGAVDELLQFRKRHDLIHHRAHLPPREPRNHPIHIDVFTPRQLRMEPGPQVDQRTQPAIYDDPSTIGLADAAYQPQQRRLPRAVAADHAHHLSGRHVQRHVLQRPKLLLHPKLAKAAHKRLLQRIRAILGIQPEPLADGFDMDAGH